MSKPHWNYVDVNCSECNTSSSIRIDQYNRRGKQWTCRSCAFTGRTLNIKNPCAKHDPVKEGAWKSYWRAKKRVRENHHGVYGDIEFRFKSFDEFWQHLGERPKGKSLDRIDPWGHYEIGNVRWATHVEQCNNKRRHNPKPCKVVRPSNQSHGKA
jgi:transposase-like protein